MFMISFIGNVPVLGSLACGLCHEGTVFDLVRCQVLADERLTRKTWLNSDTAFRAWTAASAGIRFARLEKNMSD